MIAAPSSPPEFRPVPLPEAARLPLRLYRLLFLPVLAGLLPGFALRMIRRGRYRERFGERFARYGKEVRETLAGGGWTWIHAVSVGEMMMGLKLARALREREPTLRILLSTTTSTGDAVAAAALEREAGEAARCGGALMRVYYPVDFAPVVRRALEVIRPARLVLVDKELWPNMIAECYRRGIPVSIVNARLSPRSGRRFHRFRRWVGPFFGMLDRVCVQESADGLRWAALGVRPEAIVPTGSLKYDTGGVGGAAADAGGGRADFRRWLDEAGARGPILLGGSTFPGEEALLARVLLRLRERVPGLFLVLAPRHVERCREVEEVLREAGVRWVRRSAFGATAGGGASGPVDCLLVDTTGELAEWYAQASVCFVGKSLSPEATGGQNPAEPLLAGKPVLFGPAMANFEGLVRPLLEAGGATQVRAEEELEAAVARLLAEPALAAEQVERARAVLRVHEGATHRVAARLLALAPAQAAGSPEPRGGDQQRHG